MLNPKTHPVLSLKIDCSLGADDCWNWQGTKDRAGYGYVRYEGKNWRVTRLVMEAPKETHVCHKCDNPSCINPNHLWIGNAKENIRDAYNKGRLNFQNQTHCRQGHLFDEANTSIVNNQRTCKQCNKDRKMKYRRAKGIPSWDERTFNGGKSAKGRQLEQERET